MPNRPKKGTGFDAGPTVSQVFESAAGRVPATTKSPLTAATGRANPNPGPPSAFRPGGVSVAQRQDPGPRSAQMNTDGMKFGDAFKAARSSGAKDFTWRGKKYTTELAPSGSSAPKTNPPASTRLTEGIRQGSGYRVQTPGPSVQGRPANPMGVPMRAAGNGPAFGPTLDQSRTMPMRNEFTGAAKMRNDNLTANRARNRELIENRSPNRTNNPTFQERMRLRGTDTQSTAPDFPARTSGLLPQNGGGIRMSDPAERERRRREAREK